MTDVSRRRWFGLVFISLAVALIIVDSTIVNVAIPSIVDDLKITSTQVQWVQEAYTLVFASLLLLFGSLADRVGRRRLLLIGVVLFAGASVAAALAPTGDLLILARLMQGVGGAMMLPSTLSLLNATFRGRERGIADRVRRLVAPPCPRGALDAPRPAALLDRDVPQRQRRRTRRRARRVRHHPVPPPLAAVRARIRRPADGADPHRPGRRLVRRERLRGGIQREDQSGARRAPRPCRGDRRCDRGGCRGRRGCR